MKVLVVGGGGREHAICAALEDSPKVTELHAAPGNGGISMIAETHDIKATDIEGIVKLAGEIKADYVFVAPDDPLVMGMVDALENAGFKTFGPRANAAVIEGSKVFSKGFMERCGIPTAKYKTFTAPKEAICHIKEQNTFPAVIKCDGLALGKGVIIAENITEAENAVNSMLVDGKFGKSGNQIVIEEYLTGPEVTVLAFTDGKTVYPCVASTDHKRAFDNDGGPNTGGMGVIAPAPCYSAAHSVEVMEKIIKPTIDGLREQGRAFKGCIYFGLMLTPGGVKVIEYNCRFGDPEAQVVLSLLETDLFDIMEAICEERLDSLDIKWKDRAAACVILASGGYPGSYKTGLPISGLSPEGGVPNAFVHHAGTKLINGEYRTAGGRVLGVTAVSDTLPNALDKAYTAVDRISFENMHYRKDIGKKHLADSVNA